MFTFIESELINAASPEAPNANVVPVEGSIFDDLNFAIVYIPYIFIMPSKFPEAILNWTWVNADVVLK